MTPETIPEYRLAQADEASIAALLARCFTTDFGGRSYFQTRHTWRHVIRQDAMVIAHLAVQLRAVRLGGRLLTVAGIADVATDPNHRGNGLASSLLQAALAEARRSPASHVLLFGTAGLYPAAGFRPISNPLWFLDLTGARTNALCHHASGEHLQILDLTDQPWDDTERLDLLGGLF